MLSYYITFTLQQTIDNIIMESKCLFLQEQMKEHQYNFFFHHG